MIQPLPLLFCCLPYPPYGSKENRFYTASSNDYILSVIHCCIFIVYNFKTFETLNNYNLPKLNLSLSVWLHIMNGLSLGYLHLLHNEICINITQKKKYAAFDWITRLRTRLNFIAYIIELSTNCVSINYDIYKYSEKI